MNIQIRTKRKLFVAYPWDLYIQSMYEDIFNELFKEWDIYHGSKVTLSNKEQAEVEEFLNRNKQLYNIFVESIEKSDFFIADVTKVNPNVMLELGIAIQLNKNVLIVTSNEFKELPFDITGFRVSKYKTKDELKQIIKKELRIYKRIREQNFSKYFKPFKFTYPSEGELTHGQILPLPIKSMKNLRIRLEYKFLDDSNSHDWLGIHLRAQTPYITSSELVYIRSNQKLESVSFPGQRSPEVGNPVKNQNYLKDGGFKLLEIIIEENSLKAITADYILEDNFLKNENLGGIVLHVFAHNEPTKEKLKIRYRKIEIISLDTTTPI